MTFREWKDKHPKVIRAAKIATGVIVICATGGAGYVTAENDLRVEVTSRASRATRKVDLGRAENILNEIHGAQARGFNTATAQAKYDAIISPYV